MAKKFINCHEWDKIFGNILNRGSTLADEAEKLGLNQENLEIQGDKKFGSDPKWAKVKRESERHEKAQNRKRGRNPPPTAQTAPKLPPLPPTLVKTASTTPTEEPEALPPTLAKPTNSEAPTTPAPTTPTEKPEALPPTLVKKTTLEALEAKKASLNSESVVIEDQLAEARQIVRIRTETEQQAVEAAGKAQAAFEQANRLMREAEATWRNAQAESNKAKAEVAKLEAKQAKSEADIEAINAEIETVKEKLNQQIYLVDPWFDGTLPEYGTFYSSEEMEGVEVVEVPKDYTVELVTQSILLFSDTRDVIRAKAFTELIWMYGDRGIQYTLLTEEGSVMNEFLKMYF